MIQTTETYRTLKDRQAKELNEFEGMFFAFNKEQFTEGMAKIGLTPEDKDKISYMGVGGGYIRKDRLKDFSAMFARFDSELKEMRKSEKELLKALVYELQNHEFCITLDPTEALQVLGISKEDISPRIFKKAMQLAR